MFCRLKIFSRSRRLFSPALSLFYIEACQEKWQKICQDQETGFVTVTEVIEDKGIFRIAMRGGIRQIEEMTARMRRFEQLRQ